MGDAQKNLSPLPEPTPGFPPLGQLEDSRPWAPRAIGAALVVVIVAAFAFFGRDAGRGASAAPPRQGDPYAAKLQISGLHMATAENFAGGSVTYVEGAVTNAGDRKVTGARVEVIFKNGLGEISQKESLPLLALLPNSPYVDYGPLDRAPLGPGQSRDFRLTLEHVTADWDGQIPDVRTVAVND